MGINVRRAVFADIRRRAAHGSTGNRNKTHESAVSASSTPDYQMRLPAQRTAGRCCSIRHRQSSCGRQPESIEVCADLPPCESAYWEFLLPERHVPLEHWLKAYGYEELLAATSVSRDKLACEITWSL